MLNDDTMPADELVHFASFLYGSAWRDNLSKDLNISRKDLVLTLASGAKIPENMVSAVLDLVEQKLDRMAIERDQMQRRVSDLRLKLNVQQRTTQPKVSRRTAS